MTLENLAKIGKLKQRSATCEDAAAVGDVPPVVQQLTFGSCSEHRQLAGCFAGNT